MPQIFEISRSAMTVEWQRMEMVAQNLANAGTTRTATGEPYHPMRLVSGPAGPLSAVAGQNKKHTFANSLTGVKAYGYEPMSVQPRLVHEPSHPHADANGFVSYPGIDHASEMALMVKTVRVYEANVGAFNAARSMYMKALELGGR